MAEFTASALQEVAENQNVLFTNYYKSNNNSIFHRDGSGLVTLRGVTCQCRAKFKVSFGANIAVPTGGTAEAISLALAVNGEPIAYTEMIETPVAVEEFSNVSRTTFIDVPASCCVTLTVQNTSAQAINVQNANLVVERVA